MTIKELVEEMREDFSRFYKNEFLHLRKKVDWIFIFMLTAAVTAISTLVIIIFNRFF